MRLAAGRHTMHVVRYLLMALVFTAVVLYCGIAR